MQCKIGPTFLAKWSGERKKHMKPYAAYTKEELAAERKALQEEFEIWKAKGLKLNMARGKPGKEQLDLVSDILTVLSKPEDCVSDGIDARNYGELAGLPAARRLWADILGCKPEETFLGGSSSLTLMYDVVSKAMTHGLKNSPKPWCKEEKLRWLCPVPGYDRHFSVTETFGIEMLNVPMLETGPDMDVVEELIQDPTVKGMWCVPKYSNPQGIIYSMETIKRLAAMKPAAPDFALMWDNAYCVHEFDGDYVEFPDMIALCREAGNPDMVFEFASTSKITFPGAGISVLAASEANIQYMQSLMNLQMISHDKVNQLRHVKYLQTKAHTLELMKRHAQIVKPRFDVVADALEREIRPLEIASWTRPKGRYFISFDAMEGTATRALQLCKEAGVTLTPAGSTYPYKKDPKDQNIRIAPSLPPVEELEQAVEVFCVCVKLAALEKLDA